MKIEPALNALVIASVAWSANWGWALPLIVLTVVIHVLCLGLMIQTAIRVSSDIMQRLQPTAVFVAVMGAATVFATCLHGIEAVIWSVAYRLLDALPDNKSAMLYSLNAMTSYGHTNLALEAHWQLMGALESLNGWLLFGLTTAFLFGMIDKLWFFGGGRQR